MVKCAADLKDKDIPVSGPCPICMDLNPHNDHAWKKLRNHMVQVHGLDPLGNSRRTGNWQKRNREKVNEMQRDYQAKYRKAKIHGKNNFDG